jgi:hypothetical protein
MQAQAKRMKNLRDPSEKSVRAIERIWMNFCFGSEKMICDLDFLL